MFVRESPTSSRRHRALLATVDSMAEVDTFSQSSGYISAAANGDADNWAEYDAAEIATYYRNRPVLLARRLLQIGFSLGTWLGKRWLDGKLGRADETFRVFELWA